MSEVLNNCNNVSVYLGGNCNFDCGYCDRSYIKNSVGYQRMTLEDVPRIMDFFRSLVVDGKFPTEVISFFGGEPFVFVSVMDKIIESCLAEGWTDVKFFVQTNGSLILKNSDFIRKYNKRLRISISYDFSFQAENRTVFDIESTLSLLNEAGVDFVQMQHVLPVNRRDAFSVDHLASIVKLFGRFRINRLSLIPLRHLRGHGRFRTFVKDVPLPLIFQKLTQYLQLLWVYGIPTVVDGMEHSIQKGYFNNHKQLVLAPDGFLYPEYDFIEYKVEAARIGEWREQIRLNRKTTDDHLTHERCHTCPARGECGIKYLYKIFDHAPDDICLDVNRTYMLINRHNLKLTRTPKLIDLVGIQQ